MCYVLGSIQHCQQYSGICSGRYCTGRPDVQQRSGFLVKQAFTRNNDDDDGHAAADDDDILYEPCFSLHNTCYITKIDSCIHM